MEQIINLSNAASTPFTQGQIFAMAYNMVFKTGLYNNTCCKWLCCLTADKTWENSEAHYSTAEQDLRE